MKYIVYITTNLKNNKIYIGVHQTENPEIFDGYLGCGINRYNKSSIYNPKTPFQYAVKKYGFDAFKRSIIQVFNTQQEALELEEQLVNQEFIKRTDTYNITLGGGMPPLLNKVIYMYDLQGNYIQEFISITDAAKFVQGAANTICNAVLHKRTSYDYLWSDLKMDKLNISEFNVYKPNTIVYVYNEDGTYFKTFNSMVDCAKYLNASLSNIQRSIKIGNSVKGYYISDKLYSIFIKPKVTRLSGKVHQYSLDGTYIKSYNTIKEVEQEFNQSMQGINTSIRMGQSYKNYLWLRDEKLDFVKPYKAKSSPRKIGQYTMSGKLIKVFNTLRAARKEFPNVSKVLNGTAKHCHNFNFKYLE